ncbi:TetR/AcrR family transcriptional regulator, partial [Allorhizocola rhizosphaerae]|uniref:TetR/AcrR family transcriptional regulator n=1 Tax=Allorhizocola rhizosphaerae TaxID=1872709 RepID=UPI0013C2C415
MTQAQASGARARTRQAILNAAIEVLARNQGASLGDIATAAEVGRTTLHRYFADRAELIAAVGEETLARLNRATERARLGEGTGGDAIRRLCQEYFELGDLLSLMFAEPGLLTGPEWTEMGTCDPEFVAVVERGYHDGTIDPELPAEWIQNIIWAQLYSGWSYQRETAAPRYEVLRLILRTITPTLPPP